MIKGVIIFTDISGSSKLWNKYKNKFYKKLQKLNNIIETKIKKYNGMVVKLIGDSHMIFFDDKNILNSLNFVFELQKYLYEKNFNINGEKIMEAESFGFLLIQIVMISALIERAVAQVKAIISNSFFDKPWPVIAFIFTGALVWAYDLKIVESIVMLKPSDVLFIPGQFFDYVITTLTMAGGSSGIVDLMKSIQKKRQELHEVTIKKNG